MESLAVPGMLPPPPPVIPSGLLPEKILETKLVPMARTGVGRQGQRIQLLSNHFNVKVGKTEGYFYQYSVYFPFLLSQFLLLWCVFCAYNLISYAVKVAISYEDGKSVDAKGIGRKVLDKVHETYSSELSGKYFAYDGEKSLFTIGSLPQNKLEFTVILEEFSSSRR